MSDFSLNRSKSIWYLPNRSRIAALLVSLALVSFPAIACELILKSFGLQWLAFVLWPLAPGGVFVLYFIWSKGAKECVFSRNSSGNLSSDRFSIGELNWLDRLRFLPIHDKRGAASLCCVVCVVSAMLGYIALNRVISASVGSAWMPLVLLWGSQFIAFKLLRRWVWVSAREWEREGGDTAVLEKTG